MHFRDAFVFVLQLLETAIAPEALLFVTSVGDSQLSRLLPGTHAWTPFPCWIPGLQCLQENGKHQPGCLLLLGP